MFAEVPVRFLNPTLVSNYKGFSDVNVGFKYAFVAEPDRFYTFQTRLYAPTGASDRGLGTGHATIEPAASSSSIGLRSGFISAASSATGSRSTARTSPVTSSGTASD